MNNQSFASATKSLPTHSHSIGTGAKAIACLALMLSGHAWGQTRHPFQEYSQGIAATSEIKSLGDDAFGEQVSFFTGATEFSNSDIVLAGNSSLPVSLGRRFTVRDKQGSVGDLSQFSIRGFADWDVNVPYIMGTFDKTEGWVMGNASDPNRLKRCSSTVRPYVGYYDASTWSKVWTGNSLYLAGAGEEIVMKAISGAYGTPADGNVYPWTTKSNVRLRCLASTANGYPGEAFVAVTPAGEKYFLDWAFEKDAAPINDQVTLSSRPTRQRKLVYLLASRIEDRYGNYVTYTYTQGKLTSISSNDGRQIEIAYSGDRIVSASAANRTWNYQYNATSGDLEVVTLPDGSKWKYAKAGVLNEFRVNYVAQNDPDTYDPCNPPAGFWSSPFTYSITHPSGVQASFTFKQYRMYRGGDQCYPPPGSLNSFFDAWAISSRTVSGPGLAPLTTTYSIRTSPITGDSAGWTSTVTHPDGSQDLYLFGTTIRRISDTEIDTNEGLLLKKRKIVSAGGTTLRDEVSAYQTDPTLATVYPKWIGTALHSYYSFEGRVRPLWKSTVVQQGIAFDSKVNVFDSMARATSITKSSTPSP